MSFYPPEGGGGISPSTPLAITNMPDLYNTNKTVRYTNDFAGQPSSPPSPFVSGAMSSGTSVNVGYESENRVCLLDMSSATTAGSGFYSGVLQSGCQHSTKLTFTVHFKMPAVIDSGTTILIGTSSSTGTDRSAIEITGSTCQVKNIVGGVTTATGGTYTVTANTWYIGRVKYNGDSSAVFSLYSESGTLLYTYTVNAALFNGVHICLRAFNSGVVAVPLVRLDYIEVVIPIANRYYLE